MTPDQQLLLDTRRQFFQRCGISLGQIALASLISDGKVFSAGTDAVNTMRAKPPHFPAKVNNVIYFFTVGKCGGFARIGFTATVPALNTLPSLINEARA